MVSLHSQPVKLSLAHFFLIYVTVFITVILVAWLFFMRWRGSLEKKGQRIYVCKIKTCRVTVEEPVPYRKPRCPECGAEAVISSELKG